METQQHEAKRPATVPVAEREPGGLLASERWRRRQTFTVEEAAEILRLTRWLAYAAAQRGDLPTIRFAASTVTAANDDRPAGGRAHDQRRRRRIHAVARPDPCWVMAPGTAERARQGRQGRKHSVEGGLAEHTPLASAGTSHKFFLSLNGWPTAVATVLDAKERGAPNESRSVKPETSCRPSAPLLLGVVGAMPSRLRWLSSGSTRLAHTYDE